MKTDESNKSVRPKFCGVIPPLITPLRSSRELDVAGLERLMEHVIVGGVHGAFVLGSTGEALSLAIVCGAKWWNTLAGLFVGESRCLSESQTPFLRNR